MWYRDAVGGMGDEIGMLQYKFLLLCGLKSEHYFLDVGCGSLRGGRYFINYLKERHYFGIDKDQALLDAGTTFELSDTMRRKKPVLVQMEDFSFSSLQVKFQYALAHSVFTHLPLNSIIGCLTNIETVLSEGGEFYATFFEVPPGKSRFDPLSHPGGITTFFDKDPYHYNFTIFENLCSETGLKVEYIGDWNHPRNQKMMVFRRK